LSNKRLLCESGRGGEGIENVTLFIRGEKGGSSVTATTKWIPSRSTQGKGNETKKERTTCNPVQPRKLNEPEQHVGRDAQQENTVDLNTARYQKGARGRERDREKRGPTPGGPIVITGEGETASRGRQIVYHDVHNAMTKETPVRKGLTKRLNIPALESLKALEEKKKKRRDCEKKRPTGQKDAFPVEVI